MKTAGTIAKKGFERKKRFKKDLFFAIDYDILQGL
jgi:hypothetical protein